jgi:hypothetical protein
MGFRVNQDLTFFYGNLASIPWKGGIFKEVFSIP